MVIGEIDKHEVIKLMRQTLELPPTNVYALDDSLIAASIRRVAGFQCPCSRGSLIGTLMSSLSTLVDDEDALVEQLESGMEKLFVVGDLLEFSEISISDLEAKGTWVFAAPPGFVSRSNGNIFIFGLTTDENSPIPSLSSRITYDGYKRIIRPQEGEHLASTLRDLGLVHVLEKTWLQLPKAKGAESFFGELKQKFLSGKSPGELTDVEIIDYRLPFNFYRKRWVIPTDQTGVFVGRRPQVYGSPVWGLFELSKGVVINFFDFPYSFNGIRQRGCDIAWHCHLAIDSIHGHPQNFGLRRADQGVIFDFFSPIPLWAERRLSVIGNLMHASNSLFSYFIPQEESADEELFLREHLWMKPLP